MAKMYYLASSSTTVKFHSFPDGELMYNYQPGPKVDGPVRDISWSKDGSWLSLIPNSGQAEVISIRNNLKHIHTVLDVDEPTCTAFQNTTKKFIAFGTRNGHILIYDIKSKCIKNRYPRASFPITHVAFTARDTHLVVGCSNGEILLYSNLTLGLSATYKIPKSESVNALRTNPFKRNFIVGGSNEGVVVVWDTNMNKPKFFAESHKAPVTGVAFSPTNSDLILSTGADRQFFFYDTLSNKCIASVPVKNNITAVDFSLDGTHFVMASQEGNISIYDSRRILEPVLTFEGHKSTIKNIAFQKQDVSNSSSMLEEKMISEKKIAEQNSTTNESFGVFLNNNREEVDLPDYKGTSTSFMPEDSFMAAIGLGNRNTSESLGNRNSAVSYSKNCQGDWEESQTEHLANANLATSDKKSLYEKRSILQKHASTSTPNYPLVAGSKLETMFSPIVLEEKEEAEKNPFALEELKKITADVMREQITDQIQKITEETVKKQMADIFESISYEMKYQFSISKAEFRRMCLDMHMYTVRESIKMENLMNALREDLAANTPMSENYLLEENSRLKKQISLLEEQLANNKIEYTNGNT